MWQFFLLLLCRASSFCWEWLTVLWGTRFSQTGLVFKTVPQGDTIWLSVIIWRYALFNKDLKLLVGTPSEMSLLSFFQLQPVFSDLEHLRDQHLLLSVKSCDGFESYGTWSSLSCRFEWSSQKQWFGFRNNYIITSNIHIFWMSSKGTVEIFWSYWANLVTSCIFWFVKMDLHLAT